MTGNYGEAYKRTNISSNEVKMLSFEGVDGTDAHYQNARVVDQDSTTHKVNIPVSGEEWLDKHGQLWCLGEHEPMVHRIRRLRIPLDISLLRYVFS